MLMVARIAQLEGTQMSQSNLKGGEMSDDDMKLPVGKTCGDCLHFGRCKWLVGVRGKETTCDFAPSRFQEKP